MYYYPGEKVRVECVMCNIALVLNGHPKGWARIKNIDDFMEKGEKFGSKDGPEIEMVHNAEFLEDEIVTESNETISEPYFHQKHGYLMIENANVRSQGVYFCFDEDSVASQRHFHVLIPILPIRHVSKEGIDEIKEISNGCSSSARSFPDHFWIDSNEAERFDDQETCFARNGFADWSCYDYRTSIRQQGCENPASSCRMPISFPTLPAEIPISISLQWSPWSDCKNRVQTRKGDCFISLDRQLSQSDALTKKWNWLWKLNRITNNLAFREGLPVYNALLVSWLYEVVSLESCLDTEVAKSGIIDGYDDFFKNVFNSIFPNKTSKLETPESAFKYCIKYEKLDDKYDSLRGTYTEDRRTC